MYSGHLLSIECLGHIVLVRDEVVHIAAPGLHWRHVQLDQVTQGSVGLLRVIRLFSQETLSEESSGPGEVKWTLIHQLSNVNILPSHQLQLITQHLELLILQLLSLHGDCDPVVCGEGDGQQSRGN